MSTPLILMATDRPGWCFDNIAQAIQRSLSQHYRFKIMPFGKIVKEECDALVSLCWERTLHINSAVRCRGVVSCLYDHLSWNIDDNAKAHFKLVLRHSAAVTVCNESMMAALRSAIPPGELPPAFLLEDGVDTTMFMQQIPPDKFACGWTGMSTRATPGGPADYKGLGLLREACTLAGADLRVLDAAGGQGVWPHQRMPVFYQDVTVQLIGSVYEGTPNPLLEALSCGRPVITTDVGLASKLIKNGENGFIVERNPKAFAESIRWFRPKTHAELVDIGNKCRQAAIRYSWENKASEWKRCIDTALLGYDTARARNNVVVYSVRGELPPAAPLPTASSSPPPSPAPPAPPPPSPAPPPPPPVDSAPTAPDVRPRAAGSPPRVLLISDVRNWAFHQNMKDLEEYLRGSFEFAHWFVMDWITSAFIPDMADFDVVFSVYHRWGINHLLPWDRTVGSLRAAWFFPENPTVPGQKEFDLVNRYRAFHVVTQQNFEELKHSCPHVVYLTNPVNMKRFPTATPVTDRLIASWNGNAKHYSGNLEVKGFHGLIRPACQAADVPLVYAEYNTCRLAQEEMPAFYLKANVAICASAYEGASNSVMEAAASGQAIISTPVGNIVEIRDSQMKHYGETGILLIDRNMSSIIAALNELKEDLPRVVRMGKVNREEISERWSWSHWAKPYADFLKMGL